MLSGVDVHKAALTFPACRSITQSVIVGKACPFQQTTQELTWPQCLCGHRHVCVCTLCRQVYKFVEVSDSVHDLDVSLYDNKCWQPMFCTYASQFSQPQGQVENNNYTTAEPSAPQVTDSASLVALYTNDM